MSRVFLAQYHGRCIGCDEQVEPGEEVCYEDGDLVHAGCADDPEFPS